MTSQTSRVHPLPILALLLLLGACYAYFATFGQGADDYVDDAGSVQYTLNAHDHFVYVDNIEDIQHEGLQYQFNNDVGIATLYVALSWILPLPHDTSFIATAFVFNCLTISAIFFLYLRICQELKLDQGALLLFFANLSLIYFSQLINKDALTILAFLLTVLLGLTGQMRWLWLVLPLYALVRQQLLLFGLIYLALIYSRRPVRTALLLYVLTSLVAGLLSVFAQVIGEDSLGEGLSARLIEFNSSYYIGYTLFNPLRVVQYIYDTLLSFDVVTDTGGIEAAKLLRLPQLVLLLFLTPVLLRLFANFRTEMVTPRSRELLFAILAYLMAWLMNPTVNARYVMLITPVLVLWALHGRQRAQTR
ncbi:hypothetical protein CDL60_16580 [Roseateles noduli]|nr:hypothetical protein CDL60_16580 [Roseateles noduli]